MRNAIPASLVACALLWAPAQAARAGGPAAPAAAAAQAGASSPAQRLERRFLRIAAANLRFQAQASMLAAARSGNPLVEDLANTLAARQQTAQPELVRLLHVRGMALPILTGQQSRVLRQLARLQGARFDRMYLEQVVLRSCRDDIANYEKLSTEAQDPVLRAWVQRQLPALRVHHAKAGKALPNAALRAQRAV